MDAQSRFQRLQKSDLDPSPFEQFQKWWLIAQEQVKLYPEFMILSTVDEKNYPQSRVVLLRGFTPPYFQFFTNYNSHKSTELQKHPKASLLFFWKELGKQIRILGQVTPCTEMDSDNYWNTRPRESQIHAWASAQSAPIANYETLLNNVKDIEEKFKDTPIPRPPHWGGLQLEAESFEFWQEGEFRLHHRFTYSKISPQQWQITRLNP